MLLGMLGLLGLIICLGLFIARAVKRKPKKPFGIGILLCLVLFTVGVAIDSGNGDREPIQLEAPEQSASMEPLSEPDPEEAEPSPAPPSAPSDPVTPPSTPEPAPEPAPEPEPSPAPVPEPTPEPAPEPAAVPETPVGTDYILNTNTMKFHYPSCHHADRISEENRTSFTGTRDQLLAKNYDPCGVCNP